jgi:hypothetical protein
MSLKLRFIVQSLFYFEARGPCRRPATPDWAHPLGAGWPLFWGVFVCRVRMCQVHEQVVVEPAFPGPEALRLGDADWRKPCYGFGGQAKRVAGGSSRPQAASSFPAVPCIFSWRRRRVSPWAGVSVLKRCGGF